jgi:hypothetical protein
MSRYDHKIETSLEGIEHLSKEKKEEIFVGAQLLIQIEFRSS